MLLQLVCPGEQAGPVGSGFGLKLKEKMPACRVNGENGINSVLEIQASALNNYLRTTLIGNPTYGSEEVMLCAITIVLTGMTVRFKEVKRLSRMGELISAV
jgi:hypothetical protein